MPRKERNCLAFFCLLDTPPEFYFCFLPNDNHHSIVIQAGIFQPPVPLRRRARTEP